ncbi:MAG: M56 family metallopeptidase, partial [Eubacteriales bacterium]|nr:M56 family metallopeptidase [Eubacteriales bacterium]
MIYNSFLWVLDRSRAAVIVIVAVLLARVLLRRAQKKYSYMLWAIVALRLIIPVDIPSPVSIYNLVNTPQAYTRDRIAAALEIADGNIRGNISNQGDVGASNVMGNPVPNSGSERNGMRQSVSGNSTGDVYTDYGRKNVVKSGKKKLSALLMKVSYVWLCGMVVLFFWNMMLLYRMKRRLRYGVRLMDNVYECDNIPTPFVFGWVRPRIYIPFRLSEKEQSYIIAHEQYHIKRKDYAIKVFTFFICSIYWFHPMVWLAYILMNRDMEMSCDEYVLLHCEDDIRKDYSNSLLSFAANRRMWGAGMLAFGESAVKKRVTHVMKFQKAKKRMAFTAAAVVVVAGVCCLTGKVKEKSSTEMVVNQLASSENSWAILDETQMGDREIALLCLGAKGEKLRPENGYFHAGARDLKMGKMKFTLVCSKDGDLLGQLDLSGNMLGQGELSFPEDGIRLTLFDCDGDGKDNDFALGQKITADGGNTMSYGFFGVDEKGEIYRYAVPESEDGAVIHTAEGEYSQPFARKDGVILYESPEGEESSVGICRKQPIPERKKNDSVSAIYDNVKRTMPEKVTEELEKSGWITMRYPEEGMVTYSFGNDEWEPDLRLDFTFDFQGNLLQYENKEYGFTEQMRKGAHKDILHTEYIQAFAKAFVREDLILAEKRATNAVWEVKGMGRYDDNSYYQCYKDYDGGFYVIDAITGMVIKYEKEI